jgi:hypothetical protein
MSLGIKSSATIEFSGGLGPGVDKPVTGTVIGTGGESANDEGIRENVTDD